MSDTIELAVRKAARMAIQVDDTLSIDECKYNRFLDPDYDPFEEFRHTLMFLNLALMYREKLNDPNR